VTLVLTPIPRLSPEHRETWTVTPGDTLSALRVKPKGKKAKKKAAKLAKRIDQGETLYDITGRPRSVATLPGFRQGVAPANKGKVYGQDYLRPHEIQGLLEQCAKKRTPAARRTYALIVVLWRSGLRIHEALLLEPRDLDPGNLRLHVRRGKGGKPRRAQMDAWGFEQIQSWLDYRSRYPEGPIFCVTAGATKGVRAVSAPSVRVKLRDLRDAAGVTRRVHPHAFRHSLACELMLAGKPLSHIQRALGHSNPATTATYLQGLGMDEGLEAVAARPAPEWAA
jgi:integrase